MPDPAMLPSNIIAMWYCIGCGKHLEYPSCPVCNVEKKAEEQPATLSVFISETVGASGKIGG